MHIVELIHRPPPPTLRNTQKHASTRVRVRARARTRNSFSLHAVLLSLSPSLPHPPSQPPSLSLLLSSLPLPLSLSLSPSHPPSLPPSLPPSPSPSPSLPSLSPLPLLSLLLQHGQRLRHLPRLRRLPRRHRLLHVIGRRGGCACFSLLFCVCCRDRACVGRVSIVRRRKEAAAAAILWFGRGGCLWCRWLSLAVVAVAGVFLIATTKV